VCSVRHAYREELNNHSADARVAQIASQQYGVVSLSQLRSVGMGKSAVSARVSAGRLHRLHRGVYAVGHRAVTPDALDLAVVLACGRDAVLSHRSAAYRWALLRHVARVDVTAPRQVRVPGVSSHRSALTPDDRAVVDAIPPVTSAARTLVDLAEVLTERRLADVVHEAEVQRILDLRRIEQALGRVPGRPGRHRLRRALAAYDGGPPMTRSEAERRFLRLCATHSIATPQTDVMVGGREVDFHWPDAGLVVEIDGAATHHTRRAFHADRRRDRELAARGIQVLRVTWRDLEGNGSSLAAELRNVRLARR
jgi:very-short-patch-repair endonuclease